MKQMTTWMRSAAVVAITIAGLACSKSAPEGQMTLTFKELPKLKATAPVGTRVTRNAVGLGVMLKGPEVSMTIGSQIDVDAETLDEAKSNAQAYSPKDIEGEQLSDGYILTYSSDGPVGTNYWLVGRRRLEGADYTCGVSSPKKAHQQTAIAICKSLTK